MEKDVNVSYIPHPHPGLVRFCPLGHRLLGTAESLQALGPPANAPHHFQIKQFNFSVPYIFLKIIEDLKELSFIWVVPSDICKELKLKLRDFKNTYVLK